MICNLKTGLLCLSKLKHRSQLDKCNKLTFYRFRCLQSLLSLYFSTSTILPSIKVLTGEPTITVTRVHAHTHTQMSHIDCKVLQP